MAPDEYSTGGGGKLKLKGSKVSDGRVEKKKKKSVKKAEKAEKAEQDQPREEPDAETKSPAEDTEGTAKTEAEKKYEEIRRKRVRVLNIPF
jgi:protein FAM32A